MPTCGHVRKYTTLLCLSGNSSNRIFRLSVIFFHTRWETRIQMDSRGQQFFVCLRLHLHCIDTGILRPAES